MGGLGKVKIPPCPCKERGDKGGAPAEAEPLPIILLIEFYAIQPPPTTISAS